MCVCVHVYTCIIQYNDLQEPDTPDIAVITTATTATTSHQPSLVLHDSDDTLVADVEEESVVMVSQRRCYHPSVTSSHHHYTSQTDGASGTYIP